MADEVEIVETEDTITETVIAEERDLIDQLIDDLNDGVTGVIFDRDLIDTNRPGDWGAVFLGGEDDAEWADGHMVDQNLAIRVWAVVSDRGSGVKRQVQAVLKKGVTRQQLQARLKSVFQDSDIDVWDCKLI